MVVGEDHARRLLGHFGTRDAHRHADVGRLQRRRVVDAVAGHRHHLAAALKRLHDAQLVPGRDTGEHRGLKRGFIEAGLIQLVELDAGEHRCTWIDDAQIGRNARCRARMVAGNHDHADAGLAGLGDGDGGFLAWRIDDADGAEVFQTLFQCRRLCRIGR